MDFSLVSVNERILYDCSFRRCFVELYFCDDVVVISDMIVSLIGVIDDIGFGIGFVRILWVSRMSE